MLLDETLFQESSGYEETISHSGHRLTPQRRQVYDVLLAHRDHPTATEVFIRAKQRMPAISLATVYNCLDTLVECGLARQVNVDRDATRYCPNCEEHGHFSARNAGEVTDVQIATGKRYFQLPDSFTATSTEVTIHGVCAKCQVASNS